MGLISLGGIHQGGCIEMTKVVFCELGDGSFHYRYLVARIFQHAFGALLLSKVVLQLAFLVSRSAGVLAQGAGRLCTAVAAQ